MAKESLTVLDRMQRADHDTLIRVEGKVDGLVTDVKEMKDGVNLKLMEHESRIRVVEKVHEEVNPIQVFKDFQQLQQQMHDFKTIWKFVVALATTIGTVLGFTLSLAADSFRLFGR